MSKNDYPIEAVINGNVIATLPESCHGVCPNCGTDLDGGGIWLHFFHSLQSDGYWIAEDGGYLNDERRKLSPEEAAKVADEIADNYGASRSSGRWGRSIGLIVNDKCRETACPDCRAIWNNSTGQLTGEFLEAPEYRHG